MASILPDFEYDIFISYRHKDNKGDRWVTAFVNALKTELESTFKEDISIYFDTNPHDGLLETHNVDKSLEGKLKSLIFIPIISQTYCDPKSFAWQHELCAFNRQVKEDRLGRDIKLINGNVTSRILPVKIHDLEVEDRVLLENELGGVLRSIDFIFKSAGVNRPLRAAEDHPQDNLNKTFYRDQINKVANAIKEIIAALKTSDPSLPKQSIIATDGHRPFRNISFSLKAKVVLAVLIFLLTCALTLFISQINTESPKTSRGQSIAVLPFVDMSPRHDQEYLGDGISEEVLNLLAKVPSLKVIGRTSSFYFKGKNEDLRVIGEKLGAAHLLEGSVRKDGSKIRITAQLIRSADGMHVWSETYDRELEGIFALQDDISKSVVDALKLTLLDNPASSLANIDPLAYSLFLQGRFYYESNPLESDRNHKAIEYFKKAIEQDSTFSLPWTYLSGCYQRMTGTNLSPEFFEAKKIAERAFRLDPHSARSLVLKADIAIIEYDLKKAKQNIDAALEIEPDDSYVLRNACNVYKFIGQWDKAIAYGQKSLQNDPYNFTAQFYLFQAYLGSSHYKEMFDLLSKSIEQGNPRFTATDYEYFMNLTQIEAGKAKEVLATTNDSSYLVRAIAYTSLGMREEAAKSIKRLTTTTGPSWQLGHLSRQTGIRLAQIYVYGKDQDEVRQWLEYSLAHGERGFVTIVQDKRFQKYKDSHWFQELLKKIKMPE